MQRIILQAGPNANCPLFLSRLTTVATFLLPKLPHFTEIRSQPSAVLTCGQTRRSEMAHSAAFPCECRAMLQSYSGRNDGTAAVVPLTLFTAVSLYDLFLYASLFSPVRATCPANLVLFVFITWVIPGMENSSPNLWVTAASLHHKRSTIQHKITINRENVFELAFSVNANWLFCNVNYESQNLLVTIRENLAGGLKMLLTLPGLQSNCRASGSKMAHTTIQFLIRQSEALHISSNFR
jgi:hypothetical protein